MSPFPVAIIGIDYHTPYRGGVKSDSCLKKSGTGNYFAFKNTQKMQSLFPRAKVKENVLFTEQDGIFTSAGVASGIDLALHILEKEAGHYLTHKVARELVVYIRRGGNEAQHSVFLSYRNHLHTGVHQVQDWLNENLHKKYSIDELAEMAHMSTRNFTRIFKKETGITIGEYVALLRRGKIGELLKKPDLSRSQVARLAAECAKSSVAL